MSAESYRIGGLLIARQNMRSETKSNVTPNGKPCRTMLAFRPASYREWALLVRFFCAIIWHSRICGGFSSTLQPTTELIIAVSANSPYNGAAFADNTNADFMYDYVAPGSGLKQLGWMTFPSGWTNGLSNAGCNLYNSRATGTSYGMAISYLCQSAGGGTPSLGLWKCASDFSGGVDTSVDTSVYDTTDRNEATFAIGGGSSVVIAYVDAPVTYSYPNKVVVTVFSAVLTSSSATATVTISAGSNPVATVSGCSVSSTAFVIFWAVNALSIAYQMFTNTGVKQGSQQTLTSIAVGHTMYDGVRCLALPNNIFALTIVDAMVALHPNNSLL
jgi:hypothetical protein